MSKKQVWPHSEPFYSVWVRFPAGLFLFPQSKLLFDKNENRQGGAVSIGCKQKALRASSGDLLQKDHLAGEHLMARSQTVKIDTTGQRPARAVVGVPVDSVIHQA